jgi:hypothetical protein
MKWNFKNNSKTRNRNGNANFDLCRRGEPYRLSWVLWLSNNGQQSQKINRLTFLNFFNFLEIYFFKSLEFNDYFSTELNTLYYFFFLQIFFLISSLPLDFASVFNLVWQHDSIANLACGPYGSSFFLLPPRLKKMSAVSSHSLCVGTWKIFCCVKLFIETKAMNVECFTSSNQLFLCFEWKMVNYINFN